MGAELSVPKVKVRLGDIKKVLKGTLGIRDFVAAYADPAALGVMSPALIGLIERHMQNHETTRLINDYLQCSCAISENEKHDYIALALKAGQCDLTKVLESGLLSRFAVFKVVVSQFTRDNIDASIAQIRQTRGTEFSAEELTCLAEKKTGLDEQGFQQWMAQQYQLAVTQVATAPAEAIILSSDRSRRYGLFEDSAGKKQDALARNQPRCQEHHRQKVRY